MFRSTSKTGFSLLELMAVVAVVALVALIMVPRLAGSDDSSEVAGCHVHKGDIEIQAELWRTNTGSWPAANLAAIGADTNYFPEGLPTCPVDGSVYTIDPATGLVVGHTH